MRRFFQVNSFEMHFAREVLFSIVVTLDNYYKEIYENNPFHYCHKLSCKSPIEHSKLFLFLFYFIFNQINFSTHTKFVSCTQVEKKKWWKYSSFRQLRVTIITKDKNKYYLNSALDSSIIWRRSLRNSFQRCCYCSRYNSIGSIKWCDQIFITQNMLLKIPIQLFSDRMVLPRFAQSPRKNSCQSIWK